MFITKNRVFVSGSVAAIEVYHRWSKRFFYVLVDMEDLDLIQKEEIRLSISICYHTNYCVYNSKNQKGAKFLHRLIMKTPSDLIVDHINHNGLDNRKINLRNTTYKVNRHNRIKNNRNCLYWCNTHLLEANRRTV